MELNNLLDLAGMTLRKWRSNSSDLLISIPEQLKETSDLLISTELTLCLKILGIYWDTKKDLFHIATPSLTNIDIPTKRQVTSAASRVYDVLGWFSPAVLQMKILLQQLWQEKNG